MTQRTFIIGLDGATFDVLQPLIDAGRLPSLAAIQQRGSWGRLDSTMPPFTATAWSSFISGQNPGQHGILGFQERDAFNYGTAGGQFLNANRLELTLWEIFNQLGQSAGVINVPFSYPPRPVDGYLITGMMTPDDAPFTYPASLADELGDYQIDVTFVREGEQFRQGGFPSKRAMLAEIRAVQSKRFAACTRLLQDRPTDFFMVVLTSTDRVSHFLWDELVALAEGRAIADATVATDLAAYIAELDAGIAAILDFAEPHDHIFFLSDHGFGAAPTRRFFLNVWLEQNGWLAARETQGVFDLEALRVKIGRNPLLKKIVQAAIPASTQTKARQITERVSGDIFDWSKTKAYAVPIYFHVYGIDINKVHERRDGIVSSAEYETVRTQIIDALRRLTDDDGKPVAINVWRREEIYHGEQITTFPDIIVEFDPRYALMTSLASRQLFEAAPPPFRPGEHRQDGIFLAASPALRPVADAPNLKLLDVPATVLHANRLPLSEQFDSQVMTTLFMQEQPVTRQKFTINRQMVDELSADESASLTERLRSLGYVE